MMKKLLLVLGLMLFFAGSAFAWSNPRWTTFPLNVYIQENENAAVVQRAFNEWAVSAKPAVPFLRFRFGEGPRGLRKSQINVNFVAAVPGGRYYEVLSNSLVDGFSMVRNTSGFFYHVTINIATVDADGKKIPQNKIHSIALQAVGRSLGINCISKVNTAMSCNTEYGINRITPADVNALRNVYRYVRNPQYN